MDINYTAQDLEDHNAVGAVIKDDSGRILMQDHIKFGFWTIPIGKVKSGQPIIDALQEEVFDECGIRINDFNEIVRRKYFYDRRGKMVMCFFHIFEIIDYSGRIENK